jgi:hypothetical protein
VIVERKASGELRYVVPDGTHIPKSIPRLQAEWIVTEWGERSRLYREWRDVPVVLESEAAKSTGNK